MITTSLSRSTLKGLSYGTDPILHPVPDQVFAVKTDRGNFAKIQVISDLPNRKLRITTYHIASP